MDSVSSDPPCYVHTVFRHLPSALRPAYVTRHPNHPLTLHMGPLQFISSEGIEYARATVTFQWLPTPRVHIVAPEASPMFSIKAINDRGGTSVRVPASPATQRFIVTSAGSAGLAGIMFGKAQLGPRHGIHHILFHLPNFPTYHGEWVTRGLRAWVGRVVCEGGGWRVLLDSLKHAKHLEARLKTTGGFVITHVGRLERIDGSAFSGDHASDILEKLSFFFSFARGAWSCCVMPVGFGDDDKVRWAEWSAPLVSPYEAVLSWFSTAHPGTLAELLPGFLRRCEDGRWWNPLRKVLVWYYQCNAAPGPIDTALVLQQAALELTAWTMFVEEGRCSERGFDAMPASDRIRLMLTEAGVPLAVPAQCRELLTHSRKRNWSDGPHAITEMRNSVVHPKKREPIPFAATVDAWRLGMWYLEMVLLWLFDFRGDYQSRLEVVRHHGQVERVPWT